MKIDASTPLNKYQIREINVHLARIPLLEAALAACGAAMTSCLPILEERSWTPRGGPTACEAGPAIISAMEVIAYALHPKKAKPVDNRVSTVARTLAENADPEVQDDPNMKG